MARAKNLSEPVQFTVSLPRQHFDYLTYLATIGRLGTTESGVAEQILIRELDAKEEAGYPKIRALRSVGQ